MTAIARRIVISPTEHAVRERLRRMPFQRAQIAASVCVTFAEAVGHYRLSPMGSSFAPSLHLEALLVALEEAAKLTTSPHEVTQDTLEKVAEENMMVVFGLDGVKKIAAAYARVLDNTATGTEATDYCRTHPVSLYRLYVMSMAKLVKQVLYEQTN